MNKNYDPKARTGSSVKAKDAESDAHPVGTGIGAAGGAVAGAACCTALGRPVGTLVGGAIGAATGALSGQAVAEAVNPTVEDAYWRENYGKRDYVKRDRPYDDYQPAYRHFVTGPMDHGTDGLNTPSHPNGSFGYRRRESCVPCSLGTRATRV